MPTRFPYREPFEIGGRPYSAAEVIERLAGYVSDERRAGIARVVARRTYDVVPVLDGVLDPGNVNAVLRSSEGMGFGAAHRIEPRWDRHEPPKKLTRYDRRALRRAGRGAAKWVHLHHWPDAHACCDHLQSAGYRIVVAAIADDAVPVSSIDFSHPTALVFGNERDGVSEEVLARADARCMIPLTGFVESFNISVAAALALYQAREDRTRRLGPAGDLTADEQRILTAAYVLRSVRAAELILARTG